MTTTVNPKYTYIPWSGAVALLGTALLLFSLFGPIFLKLPFALFYITLGGGISAIFAAIIRASHEERLDSISNKKMTTDSYHLYYTTSGDPLYAENGILKIPTQNPDGTYTAKPS